MTDAPIRILICEDDVQLAELVGELLDNEGDFIVVGRAANGDEAIELASELRPELVLMDIGLPGQDGIETTRALRVLDPSLHVVIYTGSDEYGDVSRADEAGASGYLHKSALTSPELPEALRVLHQNYLSAHED